MKVVVEAGKYRDVAWEGEFVSAKGELRAVTPSYAAQLIKQSKAALYTDSDGEMSFTYK
ncbi:hypothetical protein CRG86_002450 [Photobacterium leiognathi]|nr:hypothetical protein CRG86_002450 [Photobacterium leiognathi]